MTASRASVILKAWKLRLAEDMEEMLKVFLEEDLSEFFYDREAGSWHAALK